MASCLLKKKAKWPYKECHLVMSTKAKRKLKRKGRTPLGHLYHGKRMKKTWMFYIGERFENRPFWIFDMPLAYQPWASVKSKRVYFQTLFLYLKSLHQCNFKVDFCKENFIPKKKIIFSMNLSKLSIHDYQIQAFGKKGLKVELNFEKCNQMKNDNSKIFILKDSRTCWDEKWKHV